MLKKYTARCAKGQAVIETIASIIIFVIMLALIISISVYLYVQHAMISAARESCRMASLNSGYADEATQATAITETEEYVLAAIESLTGQTPSADPDSGNIEITVSPPDLSLAAGDKTITVTIDYQMENPIPIDEFLSALGADGDAFGTIPVHATATMRYEE